MCSPDPCQARQDIQLGTGETESILRRFTRSNVQQPPYKAYSPNPARR